MSQIRLFIELSNGNRYELPVVPEQITVSDGGEYARTYTLGLGQTTFPGHRKLQTIMFTSFFPYHYDPTYVNIPEAKMLHPVDWADIFTHIFEGTKVKGRPDIIRFIMTEEYEQGQFATWIDDTFAVDDFHKEHRANELTDQWYTLTLTSARSAKITLTGENQSVPSITAPVGGPKPQASQSRPDPPQSNIYIVVAGDSLSAIAKKKLGDFALWRTIYERNKQTIGPNPDLIFPGQQLVLPTTATG